MVDVWFKKLGFSRNPFSIKPAAFSYELFGVNVDSVLSGIEDRKILFVEAPLGYGKTTLLKSIIHRFGGRRKVIYANILPSEKVDVKDLLKRASFANYITGNLPNEMILVADEAQNILPESSAEIMEFYKSGNIRAVVFFGTRYSQDCFVDEIKGMMNGNIVRLSRPTPEQAIFIVRGRIGNLPLLSNEVILSAYLRANGSPRRLLQICEDLCKEAVGKGRLSVSEQELLEIGRAKAIPAVTATATGKDERVYKAYKKKKTTGRNSERQKKMVSKPAQRLTNTSNPVSVTSVSSTAGTAGMVVSVAEVAEPAVALAIRKPAVKTAKPKRASKAAGKAKAKKPSNSSNKRQHEKAKQSGKAQKQPKPLSSSAAVKYTTEATPVESTEGSYWGEFMGMQK